MGEPASVITMPTSRPGWPLRLCQQALSAFVEALHHHGRFRMGPWRQQARARLLALSTLQRREAVQWLALQLRTGIHADDSPPRAECQTLVHSVDPALLPLLHAAPALPSHKLVPPAGSMTTAMPW